jgi:multidrug efflux pump subunit AcrA (membrane-fusion protein)
MMRRSHRGIAGLWTAMSLAAVFSQLTGCGRTSAGAAETTSPDVEAVAVKPRDIPLYREWIGTVDSQVNAAIRSQVTGYLLTQDHSDGSFVKKGELLFQIDLRPRRPGADQAMAELMLVESSGNTGHRARDCNSDLVHQRLCSRNSGTNQSRRTTYAP